MAKRNRRSGGGISDEAGGSAWKSALPEEERKSASEKLVERKETWMEWLVPPEDFVGVVHWAIVRYWGLSLWTMGLIQLGQWFGGVWLMWVLIWLGPLVGYGFISWMQRKSCGIWIWVSVGLMVLGLVLNLSGFLVLMGF
jgi:hypothetical protein